MARRYQSTSNGSRKLGFTVQLSPSNNYDGGDLEFLNAAYDPEVLRRQGIMVVFPAYFTHRVTPVTRGERIALVDWIHCDSSSQGSRRDLLIDPA